MQEEIERRKYLEKKVQGYVKSLCQQNQMCKQFIKDNFEEDDETVLQLLDTLNSLN